MSTILGGCCGCKSCELLSWGGLTLGIKVFDIPTSGASFNGEATDDDQAAYASGESYTLYNYGECSGPTILTGTVSIQLDDCTGEVTVWRSVSGTCCKPSTGGCTSYDEDGNCLETNPYTCEPLWTSVQIGTAGTIAGRSSIIDISKLKFGSSGKYDNGDPWCSFAYPYNFSDNQVYVIYTQDPYCVYNDEYGVYLHTYSSGQKSESASSNYAYFTLSFNYAAKNYEVR